MLDVHVSECFKKYLRGYLSEFSKLKKNNTKLNEERKNTQYLRKILSFYLQVGFFTFDHVRTMEAIVAIENF